MNNGVKIRTILKPNNMLAYQWPRNFDRFWALKKVNNTQRMTLLPLFWHTASSVGRTQFWRGKWRPNSKIPLGCKVDRKTFPKNTLGAHLDTEKAFKSGSKQALCIENQARRIEEKLPVWPSFALFFAQLCLVWLFYFSNGNWCCNLMKIDGSWCKYVIFSLVEVDSSV